MEKKTRQRMKASQRDTRNAKTSSVMPATTIAVYDLTIAHEFPPAMALLTTSTHWAPSFKEESVHIPTNQLVIRVNDTVEVFQNEEGSTARNHFVSCRIADGYRLQDCMERLGYCDQEHCRQQEDGD